MALTLPSPWVAFNGTRTKDYETGFYTDTQLSDIARSQRNFIDAIKGFGRKPPENNTNSCSSSMLDSASSQLSSLVSFQNMISSLVSSMKLEDVTWDDTVESLISGDFSMRGDGVSDNEQMLDRFGGLMMLKSIYDVTKNTTFSSKRISGLSREKLYVEFELENVVEGYRDFLNAVRSVPRYENDPILWSMLYCFSCPVFGVLFGNYGKDVDVVGIPMRTKYMAITLAEQFLPAVGSMLLKMGFVGNVNSQETFNRFQKIIKYFAIAFSSFASRDIVSSMSTDQVIEYIFENYKKCTVGIQIDKTAENFKDFIKVSVFNDQNTDPVIVIPLDFGLLSRSAGDLQSAVMEHTNVLDIVARTMNIENEIDSVLQDRIINTEYRDFLIDNKFGPDDVDFSNKVFRGAKDLDMLIMTTFMNINQMELIYRALRNDHMMPDDVRNAILSYYKTSGTRLSLKTRRDEMKRIPLGYIPIGESQYIEEVNITTYKINDNLFNNIGWLVGLNPGTMPKVGEGEVG